MYDVIIIGAGAAGMMAAGTAAQNGKKVLVIEKMEKAGRKIRITGKGRCNLTNARPPEEFAEQVRTNADFFATAFAEFNNRATIRFFERRGLKLDFERGDRVFPHSGKAWDVANTLEEWCRDNGVEFWFHTRVTGLMTLGGKIFGVRYMNRRGFERKEEAARVIVATGGVSYPATGSTGDGYTFASEAGHDIEPLRPSLTPLVSPHPQLRELHKLLLRNIRATLFIDGEAVREEFGEIGFSERGIEGAVALRMSRDAVDALIDGRRVKLSLDLKPALTIEILQERRTAPQVVAQAPGDARLQRVGHSIEDLRQEDRRQGDRPPDLTAQRIRAADLGLCAVRIRRRDGRRRPLRRSEPLHDGIAQSQGSLFCRRGARSGRQHRRLQPPDCILDRTAGRTAQTMKLAVRYRFRRNAERLRSHLARARFFRGHGVHSPFVYAIVRQVFMKTELAEGDRSLYAALRERGVNERRAVQLQNLFIHCGYNRFGMNRATEADLCIATADTPTDRLPQLAEAARREGATLCIMEPYADVERRNCCRRLAAEHPSTSIDNRGYLLLFNGTLPKQHFKL